jgi:hypothetical protein
MIRNRFEPEHPLLFWVLVFAGVLAVMAPVVALLGWDMWAGFLGIYAVLGVIVWVVGHGSLLLLKYASWMAQRRGASERNQLE